MSSAPVAPTAPSLASAEPVPLRLSGIVRVVLLIAALAVAAVMIWQGVTAGGNPDPTAEGTGPTVAVFDIAVLVFREGLECILVLAALMANMVGPREGQRRPVLWGVALGAAATLATWFVAVRIIESLSDNVPALALQAATGLLAVVVLLIVMNWFFHKVYWGGWITLHHQTKRRLVRQAESGRRGAAAGLIGGLALLGFASFYREGFEVVLFLQTYNLKMGGPIVLAGTAIGLLLSGIVAVLTFVAHRRLPYRRMLILTGILLGAVLLVMVGEQAQEMQLARWIPTTKIAALEAIPDWAGIWFAVFPTVETLTAQAIAALCVIGSYFAARRTAGEADKE